MCSDPGTHSGCSSACPDRGKGGSYVKSMARLQDLDSQTTSSEPLKKFFFFFLKCLGSSLKNPIRYLRKSKMCCVQTAFHEYLKAGNSGAPSPVSLIGSYLPRVELGTGEVIAVGSIPESLF